ncbi:putative Arylacetamide deacetylase [Hypsibius exemplaris]|uniref:Arylacetamide deacetylase n=1 Tax=Hypsibius exemplaris TaxID=2072580 RepID=A0A1W0WS44_HYPEX|nr:putative Arylacetamide deacetylase [Hypsibius exemplaris]
MLPLKITAVATFLAIGFAYFYSPVPDAAAVEDQWIIRKLYAFNQASKLVARIGVMLGFDSAINITRSFRSMNAKHIAKDTFDITTEDFEFDGVPVAVHRKTAWLKATNGKDAAGSLRPAIVYIHGGGWIYSFREIFAMMERYFVQQLDVVVVSVEYRLAPEHPHPQPFLDCVTAVKYLHRHAAEFGVDPAQISIAGDSAGGQLSAAVTIKLRDDGEPFLQRQILISPATQFATFRLDSFQENDRYGILSKRAVIQFWLLYMNESAQYANEFNANEHVSERVAHHKAWPYLQKYQTFPQDHVKVDEKVSKVLEAKILDPYLCPMMADSLSGLPPALILVSEFDTIRDDALAYADRLRAEGADVTLQRTNGFHGIYLFAGQGAVSGGEMVESVVTYMREAYSARSSTR